MGGISGRALFLAICLLNMNYHVEGGFKRPASPKPPTVSQGHDYTLEIVAAQMLGTPSGCFGPSSRFYTTLYNDTTRVAMGEFDLVTDTPEDLRVSTTLLKFDNTNNRRSLVKKQEDSLCDYITQRTSLTEPIYANGNMSKECPIRKGFYYFRNFLVSTKEFPVHLEESKWRLRNFFFTKNNKETIFGYEVDVLAKPIETDE